MTSRLVDDFATRTATPKPAKGSRMIERRVARAAVKAYEEKQKREVRQRDGGRCRWPGCRDKSRLEVAHIDAKGMGGDHALRSDRQNLILLCFLCHQGPHSLHAQTKRVVTLTPKGTDGICQFDVRDTATGEWKHTFTEKAIGITEARA